ncbi:hypothetical protein EDB92DRAFT_1940194 [Lactarius akahatsu]|uniref:ferric-chelate reductase (NADPH) n=1 Tax=Lactarius akahatsu TaxID=416441 RepID=A0AAD4LU00_9AGAM|nr:hypothetical protein EDB92DRAFT_1940194 [Lactarius akahatsu]
MSGVQSLASTFTHKVNAPAFVFHIDVLLLGLFALYVASTLPRALVRLFQPSEIVNGFFLWSGAQRTPPGRSNSTRTLLRADTLGRSGTVTISKGNAIAPPVHNSTGGAHAALGEDNKVTEAFSALVTPVAPRARGAQQSYAPTRVPRWTTIVHPSLAYALNFRVAPGFPLRKLLVLLAYGLIVLYASLFRSNPFKDTNRTAYIAVSQIPIVVALANKSNWLSWLSGIGYEKFHYVHRFAGRLAVIAANVHALGRLYKASLNGTLQAKIHTPDYIWGLVSLCAVDLLIAFSLSFRGDKIPGYSLFFATHITFVVVSLLAIYMHKPFIWPYILAAVALYAFDHVARTARTRYTTAWLTAETALNGGTILVEVPSLGAGWRAGQHVRIRVTGDTWFSWLATWFVGHARPFTIATGSNSGGMLLVIKARGAWTRKLLRIAAAGSAAGKSADAEGGCDGAREVRIIVEGPYSGPGYTLYTAYSGVVLVAGGSGISYVTGVLDDILQKHASGQSNVRVIEVVWSVADPDSLYSLLPELSPLMRPRTSPRAALSLRFSVHWTRMSALAPHVPRSTLPPGMHLHAGRPDVHATLQSAIASVREAYSTTTTGRTRGSDLPSGIVVGSCGPTALIDDAARAVGHVSRVDWKDVGGVESIEETFGW